MAIKQLVSEEDRAQMTVILAALFHAVRLVRVDSVPPGLTPDEFEQRRNLQLQADFDRADAFMGIIDERYPPAPPTVVPANDRGGAAPSKPGKK